MTEGPFFADDPAVRGQAAGDRPVVSPTGEGDLTGIRSAAPTPSVYVSPWEQDARRGDFWNSPFGAVLPYSQLLAAADQRAAALEFLRRGAALASTGR